MICFHPKYKERDDGTKFSFITDLIMFVLCVTRVGCQNVNHHIDYWYIFVLFRQGIKMLDSECEAG